MKKTMKWAVALIAFSILSTACSEERDDAGNGDAKPSDKTLTAFAKDFPNAQDVTWSKKKGYDVAYFTLKKAHAAIEQNSAWYNEGSDKCTFTKIEIDWAQLQGEAPAVAAAWEASQYKKDGYTLDDIDKKEYADGNTPTYKLEAELSGVEYELVYKQDGTLLSEYPDTDTGDEEDEDDPAPQQVLDKIITNLPSAVVLESETEEEGDVTLYEVEILYRRGQTEVEAELVFNAKYALLGATEEIDEKDFENTEVLPAKVYAKFLELAQGSEMEDIAKIYLTFDDFKSGTNAKYAITIETENGEGEEGEITYVIDAEGNPLK